MAHQTPTRNEVSPQEAMPRERKQKQKQSPKQKPEQDKRPSGPPDPILEKRIEIGSDESDDLTS
jgi:hypothetical protein